MRLWDDGEWADKVRRDKWPLVREALEGRGFPVEGCTNGKPQLRKGASANYEEIQLITDQALSGTVAVQPSPKVKAPAKKKPAGKKK